MTAVGTAAAVTSAAGGLRQVTGGGALRPGASQGVVVVVVGAGAVVDGTGTGT